MSLEMRSRNLEQMSKSIETQNREVDLKSIKDLIDELQTIDDNENDKVNVENYDDILSKMESVGSFGRKGIDVAHVVQDEKKVETRTHNNGFSNINTNSRLSSDDLLSIRELIDELPKKEEPKLYNANEMPLSNIPERRNAQEKLLNGEKLTLSEKLKLSGHDKPKKKLGDYECKPDYCYRAIDEEIYNLYKQTGYIKDERRTDYIEGVNNQGIDWYLGGAAPGNRYGAIVIEVPADRNYFVPAGDNGCDLTMEPNVRHMKSSPVNNAIPFSMITNVFDYRKILEDERQKNEQQFQEARQQENQQRQSIRKQQMQELIQRQQLQQMQTYTTFTEEENTMGGMSR